MLKSVEIRNNLTAKIKEAEGLGETASKEDIANITAEIKDLQARLEAAEILENAQRTTSGGASMPSESTLKAKTLGEHFVNNANERIKNRDGKFSITVENAASDPILTTGLDMTDYDTDVVTPFKRPTITSVFGQGEITGTSITYFVQTDIQERKGATKEGDTKNQRNYTFEPKTENLSKVTGFIKVSDEMIEDFAFIKSEIDSSLMYDVELDEENQVINGDGITPNLKGLLKNTAIQSSTAASAAENADEILKAKTSIQTVTGLDADTIFIHPDDYLSFRIKKDQNGQYLGGGFFQGQYGQNGVSVNPDLWATNTIQTPAIPKGKVLVGACKQGATIYRKKGMRIEATNSDGDDFKKNMVTIRAEKRLLFAVKRPKAFYLVTLAE